MKFLLICLFFTCQLFVVCSYPLNYSEQIVDCTDRSNPCIIDFNFNPEEETENFRSEERTLDETEDIISSEEDIISSEHFNSDKDEDRTLEELVLFSKTMEYFMVFLCSISILIFIITIASCVVSILQKVNNRKQVF